MEPPFRKPTVRQAAECIGFAPPLNAYPSHVYVFIRCAFCRNLFGICTDCEEPTCTC